LQANDRSSERPHRVVSAEAAPAPEAKEVAPPRGGDLEDDIGWVTNILWGTPVETTIGARAQEDGGEALGTFVALLSAEHPHLLLPYSSRQVAGRALQHYTDARRRIRAATALLGVGVRAGIPHILGDMVQVSRPADSRDAQPARPILKDYLADVLQRPDIELAVRMGGHRPNRKPVLQILSPAGDVLGYAKVGWNTLTRSLIRNEAKVLADFAERPTEPQAFAVPRLVHTGQCGDLDVLVIAAVAPLPTLGRGIYKNELLAASREIGTLEENTREELAASSWWHDIRARLERLRGVVRGSRFEVLRDLTGLIEERHGRTQVTFGGCHGDWTCWNMGRRDGKLVVLDWERSRPQVPVGLDAAHFDFDYAVKFRRRRPLVAVARLLEGRGYLLPALVREARLVRLLVALDLLEMVLRFEEARSGGLDILDTVYFGSLRSAVLSSASDC
jgi:hypothetical protein